MSLETPLVEAEQAELALFLASRQGAMDMESLDGFFCALVIGTQSISPGKWMPRALGEGEMSWESDAQMERILELMLRKWNSVASGFRLDWERQGEHRMREKMYLPAVDLQDDSSAATLGRNWARGIANGLAMLGPELMQRVRANEEAVDTLELIAALDRGETAEAKPLDNAQRKTLLAQAIIGLQHLYRDLRMNTAGNIDVGAGERPGRNDPCPCGSNRKFKKCCGSPQRLH